MFASRLQRIAWTLWILGMLLILFNWGADAHPIISWIGVGLFLCSFSVVPAVRLWNRFKPPLAPEALKHPLAHFLPDAAGVPPDLKLVQQGIHTNAQAAQTRKNPDEVLMRLDSQGRIISVFRRYLDKRGCHRKLQWALLTVQLIEYRSPEAAEAAFRYEDAEYLARYLRSHSLDAAAVGVGDECKVRAFELMNSCRPPQPLAGYEIRLRRHHIVANVDVSAVQGTRAPEEVYTYTLRLAQAIDQRLCSNSTDP